MNWFRKRGWFRWVGARRVDGVKATDWRTGYYTRNRTDLPYPPPPKPTRRLAIVLRHDPP
jgi:hypothetical protein